MISSNDTAMPSPKVLRSAESVEAHVGSHSSEPLSKNVVTTHFVKNAPNKNSQHYLNKSHCPKAQAWLAALSADANFGPGAWPS
jgi:hypothetical protein